MRKSKYLNKEFDNGWVCTHVGVASVTPAFYKGTKKRTKGQGHQHYYYVCERTTSDGKADKLVRLSDKEILKVARGITTVEAIAEARQEVSERKFTKKVSYHFIHEIN
jgi:hypothetical protein